MDRFWQKVEKTEGCWNWKGAKHVKGYGAFRYNNRMGRAHRASYEMFCGPIPDGMLVLHKCDNPSCVNPDHLFLGTNSDNMADKVAKGREAHVGVKGVAHPRAKLTEEQVTAIRVLSAPITHIAAAYGVSPTTIHDIRTRKRWSHI